MKLIGFAVLTGAAFVGLAVAGGGWSSRAPLPLARTEVAATAFGREIVVVGGFVESGGSTGRVDVYEPSSDTWRSGPDLPTGVNHASAVVARGRLFVVGGYGAERSAFVLSGNSWKTLSLPSPRAAAGAAAVRGTVYVAGGVAENGNARSMLAYNTRSGRWRTLPGPRPRQHLAVAATRGRIYAIAGRTSGLNTNFTLVESWAPGEKRWRREAPVPEARGGTGASASQRSAEWSTSSAAARSRACTSATRTNPCASAREHRAYARQAVLPIVAPTTAITAPPNVT